ncbi:hypothetical protein QWZ03_13490 [Chitinimonas viridis]|uniref:Uncharacterized protein n=1 Tax=Chitinimonas viridis TaxID=664880 RepID=A0ABT8B835_9NEIS|nr:hypothetical protein [Chitinimonas viridis]MDN3577781.1 hypothetical protein [Chitinimonas viridis]
MSENVYLLTICLPLGTILLIFGMRYYAAVMQAKANLAHQEAYRQMAASMATSQAATTAMLSSIDTAMTDIRSRMAAVEKILKDVE